MKPFVSIIVPCRNEIKYILPCLQSLLENDYPEDRVEIIVVDGMSDDGTWEQLQLVARVYPNIALVSNVNKQKYTGLNMALGIAKGDRVMVCDAHATYTTNYINELVKHDADNVGAIQAEMPRNKGFLANSVVLARTWAFGVLRGG